MGKQVIQQPDGNFAIFSSETDTIIGHTLSEYEIIDHFAYAAYAKARDDAIRLLDKIKSGQTRIYAQFTLTWEEALEEDKEHDGDTWKFFVED